MSILINASVTLLLTSSISSHAYAASDDGSTVGLSSPQFVDSAKSAIPGIKEVTCGAFTVEVPANWTSFGTEEFTALRQQYLIQSEEIYRQFSGTKDSSKVVDVGAFHISGDSGSFIIVSFTVPPHSDLVNLLKSQVDDKVAWGIQEGYIRKYLGLVPVNDEHFSGFYIKLIGSNGRLEISGGLEHRKLKNTVIQLTLLCPGSWDEAKASKTLSDVFKSVKL